MTPVETFNRKHLQPSMAEYDIFIPKHNFLKRKLIFKKSKDKFPSTISKEYMGTRNIFPCIEAVLIELKTTMDKGKEKTWALRVRLIDSFNFTGSLYNTFKNFL